ncbi:TerB family tellurite resistance protein [Elioraea sp.]|uniref:TerB family tellurite resistance protein n=1 Tax=Elioraea sp. TaxID=2185103 RepID=UPI003F715112
MSIWGKILGGVAGFAMGGPLGAVLGAALGHAADARPPGSGSPADLLGRTDPLRMAELAQMIGSRETVFSISVVALAAKLAKVDGPVKRAEINAFKRMFRFPPEAAKDIGKLWDGARQTAEGYEAFAEKLAEAFADNRTVLEEVLASLHQLALADGPINAAERRFIDDVARRMGLSERERERARSGGSARPQPDEPDPYEVLGVARNAPDDEVRAAWRQLMRENHPDTLASRNVPPRFVEHATKRVAEINNAWSRIKRERGL